MDNGVGLYYHNPDESWNNNSNFEYRYVLKESNYINNLTYNLKLLTSILLDINE